MNTTLSLESILQMLSALSLSNRQWLVDHLIRAEELENAKQHESDEEFVRELMALHYEGEPTAEEKKTMLRESHLFQESQSPSCNHKDRTIIPRRRCRRLS